MFHMAWFIGTGFGIQAWNPLGGDGVFTGYNAVEWMKPDLYVDMARSLERAGFDYLLIEDTAQVDDTYGGDAEVTLRRGLFAPKNDPMPLAAIMSQCTKHIGIVPTCSTTQYPPYLAARLFTTLDHLSNGRIGINIVTSGQQQAAQNYGMDALPPKDVRYEAANEWVDLMVQLQESWEPGAVVADVDGGCYADASKVHRVDFEGRYFRCRGPLNTIPGPQRSVPVVQAGNSPGGRDLTARFGSSLLASARTVEQMKALRADMHERLARFGRKPSDLKILFLVSPVIARTRAEALDRAAERERFRHTEAHLEHQLWYLDHLTSGQIPFGQFDLDTPVGQLVGDLPADYMSPLLSLIKGSEHRTLRQIATGEGYIGDLGLEGTPDEVSERMNEIMDEVGGDGFLLSLPITRHGIAEIADGLAPVLQRRGYIRSHYEYPTFRENLLAY